MLHPSAAPERPATHERDALGVLIASPYGLRGRGGIDRLVDLIMEAMEEAEDAHSISIARLTTRGDGTLLLAPFHFACALVQLFRAARRREVDLLHVNLASRGSTYRKLILVALARRLGVPYVVHLHGGLFDRFWPAAAAPIRRAIDRMFDGSTAIIVLGHHWAGVIRAHVPGAQSKIAVLPNATRRGRPHLPAQDGRARITFLGKLGPEKGTPELLAALARLDGQRDWNATIAGNGDVEGVREQVRILGLADRISVPGWLDSEAAASLLQRTDIFVLPSHIENLPMSVLEAFASGIATIATPVGAVPEVIEHERNGLLVPVGDVGALAQALQRLTGDPALRASLAAAALRDHAARYAISGYVRRLASIWRQAARPRLA